MIKRKVGQITIRKIGDKYAASIGGNPVKIFKRFLDAEKEVKKMRKNLGRRHYNYSK